MAKKFELGETLAEVLGKVSDSGTEQIEYLPLENLVSDERNFYSMDGVEELAANIELVGLQQPLRVIAGEPPYFVIVSGHRRAAALRILAEEDPERWKTAPCIVETASGSPELQELRLIMANADTRKMSSADLARQAERVQELLYKLKEQGVEFPGRMRDHVAEACRVSKTKLATLKVIREKLIPVWKKYWESGEMAESTAYAAAQQTPEVQLQIFQLHRDPAHTYEYSIKERADKIAKCAARKCELTEDGKCSFADKALEIEFLGKGYHSCASYGCCKSCYQFQTCRQICPLLRDRQAKQTEEEKAKRKAEKAAEKRKEDALADLAKIVWLRYGELRKEKKLSIKDAHKAQGQTIYDWKNYDEEETLEDGSAQFKYCTDLPWGYSRAEDVNRITRCADMLGCSCDYLLGRSNEKEPSAALISVDDRYPREGQYVIAYTRNFVAIPSVYFRASFMDCTEKSVANNRLTGIEYWSPRPQLPAGKKWPGQETIEGIVGGGK